MTYDCMKCFGIGEDFATVHHYQNCRGTGTADGERRRKERERQGEKKQDPESAFQERAALQQSLDHSRANIEDEAKDRAWGKGWR